jgi:hypothetical protein
MRTARDTTWSGHSQSRVAPLPPLDPVSRQLERDADATMVVYERDEYTGSHILPGPSYRNSTQAVHNEE